jgi:hypothetical protein
MVIPSFIQFSAKFPFLTKRFYDELTYFLVPEIVDPFNLRERKAKPTIPKDIDIPFSGKIVDEDVPFTASRIM